MRMGHRRSGSVADATSVSSSRNGGGGSSSSSYDIELTVSTTVPTAEASLEPSTTATSQSSTGLRGDRLEPESLRPNGYSYGSQHNEDSGFQFEDELDPILSPHGATSAEDENDSTDDEDEDDQGQWTLGAISGACGGIDCGRDALRLAANIVVAFVGAGVLGLPQAFARAGWLLGGATLAAVSALNVYAMLRLPRVRRHLARRLHRRRRNQAEKGKGHDRQGLEGYCDDDNHDAATEASPRGTSSLATKPCETYGDLGYYILGPRGETIVNVALAVSQAGFATAYIIFIAANLGHTSSTINTDTTASSPSAWHPTRGTLCLACVPGLAMLVQVRRVQALSPVSLAANLCNFAALSVVLRQDFRRRRSLPDGMLPEPQVFHAVDWGGFLYVVAITIYSMEGVGLILSLQASAGGGSDGKDGGRHHRTQFQRLFLLMLTVITLFMVFFGCAGYWAFGNETLAPVTLNLDTNDGTATFVKLALCMGLYLTYPIMMFPIWSIAERLYPETMKGWHANTSFRCAVVCLSALVAYLIPDFGKFLSLVGSSICTLLGFVLPSYFHLAILGPRLMPWQKCLDGFLLVGGVVFGVMGTVQSFQAMTTGDLAGHT